MERIDYDKNRDEAIGHFIIVAMTLGKKSDADEIIKRKHRDGMLRIEMTVNGVSIPVSSTLKEVYRRMQEDIDKQALDKAMDVLKLRKIQEIIDDLEYEMTWNMRSEGSLKLGIKPQSLGER